MELKPGYKQSEVGPIPDVWDLPRLGQLAAFITSGSRGWARYYSDNGPLFIRSQNIRDGRLDFADRQCVKPPIGTEGNRTRLETNDVLITMTGNNVGNVARVDQELGEAYISQHVGLVRLLDPSIADYVCVYLSPGSRGNLQIWASQTGQSKPGLNLRNLEDFWVALPPKDERRAIVKALSDLDALRDELERLIAKKRDLKQAAMQQLLTPPTEGGTRLPGFKGAWEMKRLGEHVRYLNHGVNPRAELVAEGSVRYLHYGDVHAASGVLLDLHRSALPFLPVERASHLDRLETGDLVLVDASEDVSGVGKSVELRIAGRTEVVSGLHTIAARFDKAILADGFKGYLQFMPPFKKQLERLAAGTKVYASNRSHVSSVELRLPHPNEQRAIAAVFSDMDAELAALKQRREKTIALKQAMMQELLTGKTRLVPLGGAHA